MWRSLVAFKPLQRATYVYIFLGACFERLCLCWRLRACLRPVASVHSFQRDTCASTSLDNIDA